MSDDELANDRTFLAWLRTSLAAMLDFLTTDERKETPRWPLMMTATAFAVPLVLCVLIGVSSERDYVDGCGRS